MTGGSNALQTVAISITPEVRDLIERAARSRGQSLGVFVAEAARKAAEETLLDRTLITVSPKAYAEFLARLDAPPAPNARLRRSLRAPAPWR